jgi:hypothetical protein
MKKMKHFLLATLLITLISSTISAQDKFFRSGLHMRSEGSPAYHMFLTDDTDLLRTTVKGFGSGLYDMFTFRQSFDLVHMGSEKVYLSLGAGYAISKFRFTENILLNYDNGVASFSLDTNSARDYVNTFFGYGKTKLVYGSFMIPLTVNFESEDLILSLGGFYDMWISGKFKSKYLENGVKVKDKIPNSELSQYPINKGKLGLSLTVASRKHRYGVSVNYMMTPFFQEGKGPLMNEFRIGLFSYTNFKDIWPAE